MWGIGLLPGRSMGLRGLSRPRRRYVGKTEIYMIRQWGFTLAGLDHTRLKLYKVAFYCYGISVYMIPIVQEQESQQKF